MKSHQASILKSENIKLKCQFKGKKTPQKTASVLPIVTMNIFRWTFLKVKNYGKLFSALTVCL